MANYQLSKTGAEIDAALDLAIEHETSKADVAGNLPAGEALHAQNADFATQIETDREIDDADEACPPIVFGTVGGNAEVQSGLMKFPELRGHTIKWNQLVQDGNFPNITNWTYYNATVTASSNVLHFTATAQYGYVAQVLAKQLIVGHKYILFVGITGGTVRIYDSVHSQNIYLTKNDFPYIFTASYPYNRIIFQNNSASDWEQIDVSNVHLHDLTDIYGAGNEPSTVDEFVRDFPMPYYPYNAGTPLSSKSSILISVGRNQWDEITELGIWEMSNGRAASSTNKIRGKNPIRILPNTAYCFTGDNFYDVCWYDADDNFISYSTPTTSNSVRTSPSNAYYCRITFSQSYGTTYNHDICIYINWDTPNLPYVAYEKQEVTLPNIKLRSVPDYANDSVIYDVAYQAGSGKRRVGIVDLGTLDWQYNSESGRFYVSFSGIKYKSTSAKTNMLCSKYETSTYNANEDKTISGASSVSVLYVKDSAYSDAATFKTAMDGVMLVYERLTETDITTTENAGWDEYISVDNFGTLQFAQDPAQDIPVPQAYFIRYTVNPTEFLDTLGENAGWDADNVALKSDIVVPDAPTTDGTYTLKVTISGGTRTYSWVADS